MAYDVAPNMSIIPTCIGNSCLQISSGMTLVANALVIVVVIGIACRRQSSGRQV